MFASVQMPGHGNRSHRLFIHALMHGKAVAAGDEEAIRFTAYFLWEQAGRPEGREQEYWLRAIERYQRQAECDRLLDDGPHSRERDR